MATIILAARRRNREITLERELREANEIRLRQGTRLHPTHVGDRDHDYDPQCSCDRCKYANDAAVRIAEEMRAELDSIEEVNWPNVIKWDNIAPIGRSELNEVVDGAFGEHETRWTITEGGES